MDKLLGQKNILLDSSLREYFESPVWPALSPRGFVVWAALLSRAIPVVGISSGSYEDLRRDCKLGSKRTVQVAVAELVEKGYVEALEVGGASNRARAYRLLRSGRDFCGGRMGEDSGLASLGRMLNDLIDHEAARVTGFGEGGGA